MKYRVIFALRLRFKLSKVEITKENSTLKYKKKLFLIDLVFDVFFFLDQHTYTLFKFTVNIKAVWNDICRLQI